jgi:hypothetical protein
MAIYTYKAPGGKTIRLEGPAGLTQADVNLYGDNMFKTEPVAAPVPAPAPKGESGFIPSIMRAGYQTSALLGDVLPAMAAKAVGAEEYAKRQMGEAAATMQRAQELYPAEVPSYKDIKGVGDALTYVKEAIGEMIPSIIPSVLTGGLAGVAARPAVAAATAAAKEYAEKQVVEAFAKGPMQQAVLEKIKKDALAEGMKAAQRTALKYQAAGALTGSAAQNVPEVFQNIYEETGKMELAPALVAGGFNSVLDAIMPIQLLRKVNTAGIPREQIIGAWYKRAGKGAVTGFLTEGGTEAVQEMSSAAAEKFVDQNKDFFTEKNFERFINSGLKGGFGGAAVTATADVLTGKAPEKVTPPSEKEEVETERELPPPPAGEKKVRLSKLERLREDLAATQARLNENLAKGRRGTMITRSEGKIERLKREIADEEAKAAAEGAPSVAEPIPGAGGAGFEILSPTDAGVSAPAPQGPELTGVAPAPATAGELAGGKAAAPATVTPPPAPPPPAPPPPKPPAQTDEERLNKLLDDDLFSRGSAAAPSRAAQINEIGKKFGLTRNAGETDEAFGTRIKNAIAFEKQREPAPGETVPLSALPTEVVAAQEVKPSKPYRPAKEQRELYEETRQEFNQYVEPDDQLPEYEALTDDERREYFQNYIQRNTQEEHDQAADALSNYIAAKRSESRSRGDVDLVRARQSYQANRDSFGRQTGLAYNFPAWGDLSPESQRAYAAINKTDSVQEQHLAFSTLKKQIQREKAEQSSREALEQAETDATRQMLAAAERARKSQPAGKGDILPDNILQKLLAGDITAVLDYIKNEGNGLALKRGYDLFRVRGPGGKPVLRRGVVNIRDSVAMGIFRSLASRLLDVSGLKVNVVFDENMVYGDVAKYDAATNTLYVGPNGLDEATVLHELTHAATVKIIHQYFTDKSKLAPHVVKAVEQMQNIASAAQARLGSKYLSAFENLYEFVAYAMTDMDFQYDLAQIQVSKLATATEKTTETFSPIQTELEAQREGKEGAKQYDGFMDNLWNSFVGTMAYMYKLFRPGQTATKILMPTEKSRLTTAKTQRQAKREEIREEIETKKVGEEEVKGLTDKEKAELGLAEKEAFAPETLFDNPEQMQEAKIKPLPGELKTKAGITNLKREILREPGYKGNLLLEAAAAFEVLLAAPEGGIQRLAGREGIGAELPSRGAAAAPTAGPRTDEEIAAEALKQVEIKEHGLKSLRQLLFSRRGYEWFVKQFQNERRVVKQISERAERFGMLQRVGAGINDVWGQLTRSTGMAVDLYNVHVRGLSEDADRAIEAYAKKKGIPVKEALSRLHLIFEARHEPERRQVKYLLRVPLDNDTKNINLDGRAYTPQAAREEILRRLADNDLKGRTPQDYRAMLDQIIAAGLFDKAAPAAELDPNNSKYNVIADRPASEIAAIKNTFDLPADRAEIDAIDAALKKLTEKTKDLNRVANYWSQPVNNVAEFYGFKNYVPFKGRKGLETSDPEIDLGSQRLGGELQDAQNAFEGRLTESENPLLQIKADAATAAMRAGRRELTLAIKNAVEQGILKGDVVKTIDFKDRYLNTELKKEFGGENSIFHYNNDGTVDIIKLDDKNQREAIRRTYRESSPILDVVNQITSGIGQSHTRYNPAFAPMNYVRDALTNAFTLGAEMGPAAAGRFLTTIAQDTVSGGFKSAFQFSRLYSDGKFNELERLASRDPYFADMLEYVTLGGRVSYLQGVAAKGALDGLMKEVGRSGVLRTKDQIDKFFDIYNDIFELSARTSAFRTMKQQFLAKGESPQEAAVHAAEYAKNFANFEQVGRWGKGAGALFMFFRPAATGAVRAIDALRPVFGFNEDKFREEAKAEGRTDEQIDRAVAQIKVEQRNARVMSATLAGFGVAMYMLAAAMSGDDEEKRNKVATDDMARWTRFARFHIPGTDMIIQIPWGFGLGAFGAAGAQIAAVMGGNATIKDALSNMTTIGLDSFLPLPFSRISPIDNFPAFMIDSVTPSMARPFLEYVMNLDGLGREIYNNRQSRYGDAYTGGDNIPEMYKLAARKLFELTDGAVDWSPNTMYFFASNFFDGGAKIASTGVNLALTMSGEKDFDPKNDTLFLSSFIGTKSNVDAREFSKAEDYIKGLDKRIKSLESNPDALARFVENNPEQYMLVKFYNQEVNGALKKIRAAANQVRADPDMSIKERKAQLQELIQMQNTVKRRLLEGFETLGYER